MKQRSKFPLLRQPGQLARHQGVTMIELLVVIAIAAIVAVIGAPSMRAMLVDFRQKSAQSLLVSDLNQARAEAIKRNARLLVCVRDSAGSGCSGSNNWSSGWVVCVDANSDNVCDAGTAASPNPLLVRPALDAALTLSGLDSAGTAVSSVRFNANSTQGGGSSRVVLSVGASGGVTRSITVAGTGNVSKQ